MWQICSLKLRNFSCNLLRASLPSRQRGQMPQWGNAMKRFLLAVAIALFASPVFAQGFGRSPAPGLSFRPHYHNPNSISSTYSYTPYGYGYSTTSRSPGMSTTYFYGPQAVPYYGGYGYPSYGYGSPYGGGWSTTYYGWGW